VLDSSEGSVRLKVARDTEISAVLARVTDQGAVASFSFQPPTLSDLFREAVST
jgi:ABC-2 type transport system ATP-binding protein